AASCRSGGRNQSLPGTAETDRGFAEGYQLYMAHCAACHGAQGRGDGLGS
ncbi:MAG: c-type cytochrome, partial [Proteobacteria bacterium]|nr:c-type cytochrome [Pseudomonadota bacterium]